MHHDGMSVVAIEKCHSGWRLVDSRFNRPPRAVSNWPDFDPEGRPRSATVVITKNDGGIIGS
jgi:secreted PhoX family phosphatase